MELKGKRALVTGGRSGIGRAIALAFAREGADVVIGYRTGRAEAEAVAKEAGGVAICADLTDPKAVEGLFSQTLSHLGGLDILVNNAAVYPRETFLETSLADFDSCYEVNLRTPFQLIQLAAPQMPPGGSIINISSIAGINAYPHLIGYCCTKAALDVLTRAAACDLAERKIRVNGIAPGVTETDANVELRQKDPDTWAELLKKIPLKRAGLPQDHAEAAIFLASDRSGWMTGDTLYVDGGQLVGVV